MPRVPQPLTRSLFLTLLTSVMLPTYGCSAPEIENGAPYLCQVIPKDAVRLVSRPDDEGSAIEEKVLEGNFSGDFYSCIAEKGLSDLGYQHWRGEPTGQAREGMLSLTGEYAEPVPSSMGEGYVDLVGSPGWVYWRCDGERILSRISYPGERDRDEQQDVLRLLEIAQQRYAELNDCEIRPPK